MKKSIIVMLLVFFISALLALESDPSETVGYVKIETQTGYYPFSLPFTFYDDTYTQTWDLDDIIGDQLTGNMIPFLADQIIPVEGGAIGYYNGTTWTGITQFQDGHAYYVVIQSANPEVDMYLAGTVEQTAVSFGTMQTGYNPVGIREAGVVSLDDIDLLSSGFTGNAIPFLSDQIIPVEGGTIGWHNGSSWQGFSTVSPGKAYFVVVQAANTPFTWTYDPSTRGDVPAVTTAPAEPKIKEEK